MDIDSLLSRITPAMITADGSGVRAAVLDGGVDPSGPGLAGRVAEAVVITETGRGADGRPTFGHRPDGGRLAPQHGTTVAAILASAAPGAVLHSADVLGPRMEATPELLAEGLRWAVAAGCRVINVSFGAVRGQVIAARRWALAEAVEAAYWAGVTVVAAAHPGHPAVASIPATFSIPVAVRRGTIDDPLRFLYGPDAGVEFEAHSRPDGRRETSATFAAPRIAALVCRLLSQFPRLKPFEIKTVLYRLAEYHRRSR